MLEFNFTPFPVLQTERLTLREINDDDLQTFFEMRSNEEVMKYVGRPRPQSPEELLPFMEQIKNGIKERKDIAWAITFKGSPEMIGQIGFWRNELDNHRGEVGYMLRPHVFGKGIASEALKGVLEYGFTRMNFHSVKGCVDPANAASINVLEKNGFVKEAHFRENYFFNGQFLDTGEYSLLASDWRKMRG